MRNKLYKSKIIISIITIPILFSCASTQQKQSESTDAEFYYTRGIAYNKKAQHDEAISDFTKALEINPRYAEAYNTRGIAYYFKKEYDKSWGDVKKAQELGHKIHPKFLEELRKASGREK